jgi:hypothetical protein
MTIARASRRGGVLPNTFQAHTQAPLVGGPLLLPAWSPVIGTPVCMGLNNDHSDCVTTAAANAVLATNGKRGIFVPIADEVPFELYAGPLGGMPADIGLDPATLFNWWQINAWCGYKLAAITAIGLTDARGLRHAVEADNFAFMTCWLTQSQMTQTQWNPVPGEARIGQHMLCLTGYEADSFSEDTWGLRDGMTDAFIAAQGMNLWAAQLVDA